MPLDPETGNQRPPPSGLVWPWVDIADVRRYQQATYSSTVRSQQRRPVLSKSSTR